jgi:hypothetical protein
MKRVLRVTLARNDNLPDNKVLAVLDAIKAHGFEMVDTPMYQAGCVVVGCEWQATGIYQTRAEALLWMAVEMGQDVAKLETEALALA